MTGSVEVVYAANMQPGDLYAGHWVPGVQVRPVQTWARAHRLTEVALYTDDGDQRMVRLKAGQFDLTPLPSSAQCLIIREPDEPSPDQVARYMRHHGVPTQIADTLPGGAGEALYTRDQVAQAVTSGADTVAGEIGISDADQDMLNLVVNTIMTLLEKPGATLDEVIVECYSEDPETVKGWCE